MVYLILTLDNLIYAGEPWRTIGHANILVYYIGAVLASYFVLLFCKALGDKNYDFVNIISKNSLFVIFYHFFILFFIWLFGIQRYIRNMQNFYLAVIISLILSLIILLICYYTILFLQKKCPFMLGKYRPKDEYCLFFKKRNKVYADDEIIKK